MDWLMLCFDIYVNGKKLARSGVGDLGVLVTSLTWVENTKSKRKRRPNAHLTIGGLAEDMHKQWKKYPIRINPGDVVTIKVVLAKAADVADYSWHRSQKRPRKSMR
jgi:hypothetical protein